MTATVSTSTMIKLIFKVLAKDTSLNQSHPFDSRYGRDGRFIQKL